MCFTEIPLQKVESKVTIEEWSIPHPGTLLNRSHEHKPRKQD
jgi:hypothetical protein